MEDLSFLKKNYKIHFSLRKKKCLPTQPIGKDGVNFYWVH